MRKILARRVQRSVVQAMDRWMEVMEDVRAARAEEERKQAVMRKILARMVQRGIAAVLNRWVECVEEVAALKAKGSKVALRWMYAVC